MKKFIFLFAIAFAPSLYAQLRIQDLAGNWKIKSYTKDGVQQKVENTYFKYYESDVGDPIMDQVFTQNNKERCVATCMVFVDGDKADHNYLMSTIEDDPSCAFWIPGAYTYELKNGILKITDDNEIMELQRK